MSIAALGGTVLNSLLSAQSYQSGPVSGFQQVQKEFQQLGTDLAAGNLSQAQQDFATLSQNFPGAQSGTQPAGTANATTTGTGTAANTSPIAQAFNALSQALGSGNLTAAQQDYANIQQDLQQQQASGPGQVHHHRHHGGGGGGQQSNNVSQVLNSLSSALQAGNLSNAQTAFATLQQDLLQYTGYNNSGSTAGSTASPAQTGSNLNVSA
jgi:hypothetical protein